MTTFQADTNATAVILADYGDVGFRVRGGMEMKRHMRVKILSEAAYDDWGTVTLTYVHANRAQRIDDLRAQTVIVGPNGEIERHKLEKDAIFEEKANDDLRRIRFTFPALQPGAVIEYSYTLRFNNPVFLPSWAFQRGEPTLYSEYRVEAPEQLRYVFTMRGTHPFSAREQETLNRPSGAQTRYRWVMEDIPALRTEPFMTTPDDYRTKLEIQLSAYMKANGTMEPFLSTWPKLAEELIASDDFGRQIDPRGRIREITQELVQGLPLPTPEAKLDTIYTYLTTNVEWDGYNAVFVDNDVEKVLEKGKGSAAEINLLLVAMLRAADIVAHPMLISTRANGQVLQVYPMVSQFNYTIAYVEIGDSVRLLDATDPLRPHTLLPTRAIVDEGWMLRETGANWLPARTEGKYVHQAQLVGDLTETGDLNGTLTTVDDGYSALFKRHTIDEDGEDAYINDHVLEGLDAVTVDSFHVDHAEAIDQRLRTTIAFSAPAHGQAAADRIYISPKLTDRIEENPLRLPERTFPLDLTYARDYSYSLQLSLPEGYIAEELPRNTRVMLPERAGMYMRAVEVKEGKLTMMTRFSVRTSYFPPELYDELRSFYDQVVAAEAEVVVLKKTDVIAGGE